MNCQLFFSGRGLRDRRRSQFSRVAMAALPEPVMQASLTPRAVGAHRLGLYNPVVTLNGWTPPAHEPGA
jgi:hypothetical protein